MRSSWSSEIILTLVSRILARPGPLYPEGRAHIIDILVSVLPGIDCNDIKKTMSVFQVRHDTRLYCET